MSIRIARVVTLILLLSVTACSAEKAGDQSASNSSQSTSSAAWADAGKMPDLFSGMWMSFAGFVEGDAKLNVPYTATAQKYVADYKPKRDIPYAQEGCQSPGLPLAMRLGGGIKFTYAPGLISIYMQSVGHTRFIKMNQKQGKTAPKYYGNSVGHWEGDTLVVETDDFLNEIAFQYGVGKGLPPEETVGTVGLGPPPIELLVALSAAIWGPHGEGMRMVERMRLVDPETLEVQLTIYDDTVWTKPYVTSRNYTRIQKGKKVKTLSGQLESMSGEPEEWVCTVSITTFDPKSNTYEDKDPEEMVEFLNKKEGR